MSLDGAVAALLLATFLGFLWSGELKKRRREKSAWAVAP
jgi:hypothetical protein